jgi:hypothetical protein
MKPLPQAASGFERLPPLYLLGVLCSRWFDGRLAVLRYRVLAPFLPLTVSAPGGCFLRFVWITGRIVLNVMFKTEATSESII